MKSSLHCVTRALGAAVLVALFSPHGVAAQSTGTLAGHVTSNGAPVSGATISATGGRYAVTRTDGSYRLTLPVGRYQVRARLLGFITATDSAVVTEGATTTLDFVLTHSVATLEAVSTLGTRGEARTVIDAPVPIDVLSAADIKQTGRTETAQMIQAIAPSFNFPRTSIGDGTDRVRPATLRGLAPDQTLVLVNGKRRHNSALVNVNGFVGRGSAPVDLNAIPASMIDHIEILRDGAAAQYGSDAIAGVINIVLKKGTPRRVRPPRSARTSRPTIAPTTSHAVPDPGRRRATRATARCSSRRSTTDGPSAQNGFLHLTGELRDRGYTNRTLPDPRVQYFAGRPARDRSDAAATDGRINHRQGDASTHDVQGFWNGGAAARLRRGLHLRRRVQARSARRRASGAARTTTARCATSTRTDSCRSSTVGHRRRLGRGGLEGHRRAAGTGTSAASTAATSSRFTIKNTANVSLGADVADGVRRRQAALPAEHHDASTSTATSRDVLPFPLNVAAGAEFRADKYAIVAGEHDSWRNGGSKVLDANGNPTTRPGAPGSQVFPGFKADSGGKKGDAGTHSRNNVGALRRPLVGPHDEAPRRRRRPVRELQRLRLDDDRQAVGALSAREGLRASRRRRAPASARRR